ALLGLRSPTRALLALLPAALASGATFGLLGLLGIPLNPMNFVAVPLVLGLGIDDGLHLVTQAWKRPEQPIAAILAESGWAVTCTTATTLAGFGALLTARHGGLVSLGGLVCLGVALSWAATVVVLPPLLRWERGGRP
ncbi:MAG: MMPL family transporter, partial [Thermodesulfobacteriota bacterium]